MIERGGGIDHLAPFADGHHQFDLVMKIRGQRWVWDCSPTLHQGIRGFAKKDRRLALRIIAHLADMIGVVAAHTKDTPNGEPLIASRECDAWLVRRTDDV